MEFRLKPHESVKKGIKRIIQREIDDALTALTHAKRNESKTVHDVRTHCKKIRAVLRLMRKDIGGKIYQRENRYFRDVMRPLTELRDARVQIKTLEKLKQLANTDSFSVVHKALQADYRVVRQRILNEKHSLDMVKKRVEEARSHLKEWSMHCKSKKVIRRGVEHMYQRTHDAFVIAEKHHVTQNLHEWRKQAKYLWYQIELLQKLQPKKLKILSKHYHRVTEILGEDHDLAVLSHTIGANDSLHNVIVRKRNELQKKAFRLGRQLYSDNCKDFKILLKMAA